MIKTKEVLKPYEHQIESVGYPALFCDCGTGKSKMVCMRAEDLYIKENIYSLLVICPNSLKDQWTKEVLDEHLPFEYVSIAWDGFNSQKKQKEFNDFMKVDNKYKVFVINYEAFSVKNAKVLKYVHQFIEENQVLTVCDESTKIKTPTANRTKLMLSTFELLKYKMILTGTPITNSPFDLYSQFVFLKRGFWKMKFHAFKLHYGIMMKKINPQTGRPFSIPIDYDTWKRVKSWLGKLKEKHGDLKYNHFMIISASLNIDTHDIGVINNQKEYTPYKNMEELKERIEPYVFRALKEDCLDLPEKVYQKLEVDLNAEQKKHLKELKKNFFTVLGDKKITVKDALPILTYSRMITGGIFPYKYDVNKIIDGEKIVETLTNYEVMENTPKIKALIEDIECQDPNRSIIVWCTFRGEFKLISKAFEKMNYDFKCHFGDTPEEERSEMIKDFKAGNLRILVINETGEEGLNLQVSSLQYFYSNDFKASSRIQKEDRSHRSGQKDTVVYKDVICKKSIDEKIMLALKRKKDLIDYFKENDIKEII